MWMHHKIQALWATKAQWPSSAEAATPSFLQALICGLCVYGDVTISSNTPPFFLMKSISLQESGSRVCYWFVMVTFVFCCFGVNCGARVKENFESAAIKVRTTAEAFCRNQANSQTCLKLSSSSYSCLKQVPPSASSYTTPHPKQPECEHWTACRN